MTDPRDPWTDVCGDVTYEIHGPPPSAKSRVRPNWKDDPEEMERLYQVGRELFKMGFVVRETETIETTGDYL